MRWHTPQPNAHLMYPLDGGWQVLRYVWTHLFARTHAGAQTWFRWGDRRFADAQALDNLIFQYWQGCLGGGAYLAGLCEYAAAMLIVSAFALLHVAFLSVWASAVLLCVAVLAVFNAAHSYVHRIFFHCPACYAHMPVPIHVCPTCRAEHTRLWPSAYGVFRHRCRCGTKLRTLDLFGRKAYVRKCAECKRVLDTRIGALTNVHIPVVGGPWVGKSSLMFMAVRELLDSAAAKGYQVGFTDGKDEAEYLRNIAQLNGGKALVKTTDMAPQAYTLELRKPAATGHLLYLYDAAGEVYADGAATRRQEYYAHVSALLLVLDPLSIPLYRQTHWQAIEAEEERLRPSPLDVEHAFGRILESLEGKLALDAGSQSKIPVAVIVSKADALDLDGRIGPTAARRLMRENPAIVLEEDATHLLVERFLAEHDLGNWLRVLRGRFASVRFFACSALGRPPGGGDARPFRPAGVLAPLSWALDATQALDNQRERLRTVDLRHREQAKRLRTVFARAKFYYWDSLKPPAIG